VQGLQFYEVWVVPLENAMLLWPGGPRSDPRPASCNVHSMSANRADTGLVNDSILTWKEDPIRCPKFERGRKKTPVDSPGVGIDDGGRPGPMPATHRIRCYSQGRTWAFLEEIEKAGL
jgi:hypothetical protein